MKRLTIIVIGLGLVLLMVGTGIVLARQSQSPSGGLANTGFTYQGQLVLNGTPVTGACDFRFDLFDAPVGGTRIATFPKPPAFSNVPVTNGLFTVVLDFGVAPFDGNARHLEIAVDCGGGLTVLAPRQKLEAVPYAVYSGATRWGGLLDKPTGFADDVDNDTQYSAGAGLVLIGTTFSSTLGTSISTAEIDNLAVTNAKIANDAVNTFKIADGQVLTQDLAANAVTTAKIANAAVGRSQILAGAVDEAKIASNAVTSVKIQDAGILALDLSNGAVLNSKLGANAVTTDKILDGSVSAADLATNAVTSSKIAVDSVGTSEIAANAVTAAEIANGAVTSSKILNDSIFSSHIFSGQVGNTDLANASVTSGKIATSAVTNFKIATNAVTSAKIADGAVTNSKIANNAVTSGKIAANSIFSTHIFSGQVGNTDLANASVSSSKIASSAVINSKIANGAVTSPKLAPDIQVANTLKVGTPTSSFGPGDIVATDDLVADDAVVAGGSVLADGGIFVGPGTRRAQLTGSFAGDLTLRGSAGAALSLVRAAPVSGTTGLNGGVWVYANGGLRGYFEVLSNNAARILLKNGAGSTTINLNGATGNKGFVMDHPLDSTKSIVYTSIEGPEAAAYTRGTVELVNGEAWVPFEEHFSLVVNPDTMTIQVTPHSADSRGLAVVERTAQGFRIKEMNGGTGNYKVDYLVQGVRKGQENYQVVRERSSFESAGPADAAALDGAEG